MATDKKRPPDFLYAEMRRAHSDLYTAIQQLRRVQEKMSLYFDELSRWDERDYPLRQSASKCFAQTSKLMDVCTSSVASAMSLDGAQKAWDEAEPVVPKKVTKTTESTQSEVSSDPVGGSPYRAEAYRPLPPVMEVDAELGEALDRYSSEEDLEDEEEGDEEEYEDEYEEEEGDE